MKILKLPDVIKTTGLSRSTIYEKIKKDAFPKQVPLGAKSCGWLETEIFAWLESRVALRNSKAVVQ